MMEVREMATAFLFNQESVLMMRKAGSKIYNDEFWTGLGGHLENEELNSPKKACLREIFEESGFQEKDIIDLSLKYILLRIKESEVRQQFVYFGKVIKKEFVCSDEGDLFWIDKNELLALRTSKIIHFMLEHYLENPNSSAVMIGTISLDEKQNPIIQWAELKDPVIF